MVRMKLFSKFGLMRIRVDVNLFLRSSKDYGIEIEKFVFSRSLVSGFRIFEKLGKNRLLGF